MLIFFVVVKSKGVRATRTIGVRVKLNQDLLWSERFSFYFYSDPNLTDSNGSGNKMLIPGLPNPIGEQPIYHSENIAARISVNIALKGHNFYPGTVTHSVNFENGNLYYDVLGAGSGATPGFNNSLGIILFAPGVMSAVRKFGM